MSYSLMRQVFLEHPLCARKLEVVASWASILVGKKTGPVSRETSKSGEYRAVVVRARKTQTRSRGPKGELSERACQGSLGGSDI